MSTKNVLIFVLLLVAAAGSWYLANKFRAPEIVKTVSDTRTSGFYLKAARILGTDDNGDLLYEIEADYAEQREDSRIELQNVRVKYSTGAEVPWTINADLATISDDESLVRLSGHVVAVSNEGFSGQVTEIRTSVLDIDPDTYTAETDSRVQIRIGSRSLTATGMLALLRDNRLQLKSNVSGKFVP